MNNSKLEDINKNLKKDSEDFNLKQQEEYKISSNVDKVYKEIKYVLFSEGFFAGHLEVYLLGSIQDKIDCVKESFCEPYFYTQTPKEFNKLVDSLTDKEIDYLFYNLKEYLCYEFYPTETINLFHKLCVKEKELIDFDDLGQYCLTIPKNIYDELEATYNLTQIKLKNQKRFNK